MPRLLTLLALVVATNAIAGVVTAAPVSPASQVESRYTVLQMNLCLSGVAGCYGRTAYPAVVDEAVGEVVADDPDAVTVDEACSGDAAEIARRAGYRLRFTAVRVGGDPLACVDPGGRGVYGLAVLTRAPITASEDQAFTVQADAEQRRWICATTKRPATVCTAHLSTRGSAVGRRTNDRQCAELEAVLARHDEAGPVVFGGDVNRRGRCSPATMWATRDAAAGQLPGIQHIYGSSTLFEPASRVVAATHTDHDFFLVRAQP